MTTTFATTKGEHTAVDGTLITRCCSECSVIYAIPLRMYERGQQTGKQWWCPNGHGQSPVASPLREQLCQERQRAGHLAAQRDQLEASNRAQKAATTRARNERDRLGKRAKAGVCPCCNRTFKQLARHMTSQHPDFDGAEVKT